MKLTKRDVYTLTAPIEAISTDDLRDLKFGLNFRWLGHLKKGHAEAAERVKVLTNVIRAELARRMALEREGAT
jgi:hypothetical protein